MIFFKKKKFLFLLLVFFNGSMAYGLPSMWWIKKNIMDFSPLNFIIDIKPRNELLDVENTYKNKLLHIAAHSCRGVVPTVGTKVKKTASSAGETLLGKDNKWGIGTVKVSSKTVSYYSVNGVYSVVFAEGTLRQRVLYTLYKMFVRKVPAHYITNKFLVLTALLGINNCLESTSRWWIGKDGYCAVFAKVAKKAVKSTFELLIDECVGCYILPHIF
ncbi:hypothetical protein KC460_02685 [Candidatus Dependentiae bacterium]|nr:hypothetical protein [Candidatus Dependentiae bacterium]